MLAAASEHLDSPLTLSASWPDALVVCGVGGGAKKSAPLVWDGNQPLVPTLGAKPPPRLKEISLIPLASFG